MKCPVCLKEIDENCVICPTCGEEIQSSAEVQKIIDDNLRSNKTNDMIKHIIFICLIIAVIITVIAFLVNTGAIWWILGIAFAILCFIVWLEG